MSNDVPPKWSRQRPASMVFRWFMVFAIFVLFALLFDLIAFLEPPFSALVFLAIGWILSGWRMVQGINDYQNLWWWLLGCIVLVVFANTFVRSVMSGKPRQWNVKKSVAATGICWFALFAGMCLAGSVHQVGWLFCSDEPWVDSGLRFKSGQKWAVTNTAKMVAQMQLKERRLDSWLAEWETLKMDEVLCPIRAVSDSKGFLRAIYVWPRKMSDFRDVGGCVVTTDGTITAHPYERMQALLSKPE